MVVEVITILIIIIPLDSIILDKMLPTIMVEEAQIAIVPIEIQILEMRLL